VNWAGVVALTVASVIGIGLVTSTSAAFSWAGYLLPLVGGRAGAIGASSLGLIVGFVVAGLLYWGLQAVPSARLRLRSAPGRPAPGRPAHDRPAGGGPAGGGDAARDPARGGAAGGGE